LRPCAASIEKRLLQLSQLHPLHSHSHHVQAPGPSAATRVIKQVTDGAEAKIKTEGNDIFVANMLLVATEDGSAVVVGTIVNYLETPDTLLGISAGGVQAVFTGEKELRQNEPIRFEGEVATSKAVFPTVGAEAGKNVTVTLAFARAGVVTLNAIIRDQRDDYSGITTGAKLATTPAE
jgi:copper(I)-binding protein